MKSGYESFNSITTPVKVYGALVDEIAHLHQRYSPAVGYCPSPLILPGQWIPSVVDTSTAAAAAKLPVVVAIGANYATGPGNLPSKSSARHRTSPPWVEENLSRWR